MTTILDLPNEILCKIMEYVPTNERPSLSTVCTRFRDVFEIPSLQQNREFDLESQVFARASTDELKNKCRSQCHWKHLKLKFRGLTKKASGRFKRLTTIFRDEFSEIWKLESLSVSFEKDWLNDLAKDSFVENFASMFCYQSQLKEVTIIKLKASSSQGCRIMRAVMESCGHTVTTLRLVDLFRIYNPRFSSRSEIILSCFVNLRHLELNYGYISSVLLQLLALLYSGQLEMLTFWVRWPAIRRLHTDSYLSHSYNLLRLLVGAPAAQATQPGVDKGGVVYKCSIDTPNACHEVPFDRSGDKYDLHSGVHERMDNKSHQWFGATLRSSGPNGVVVVAVTLTSSMVLVLLTTLLVGAILYRAHKWYRESFIADFGKKRVFVTGTDSGFGRRLAIDLDRKGLVVYAGCFTEGGAKELAEVASNRLKVIKLDITDQDSVQAAFKTVQEDLPPGEGKCKCRRRVSFLQQFYGNETVYSAHYLCKEIHRWVQACAPRYVYFSTNFKKREPVGTCYVARNFLTNFQEYAPCRTSDWGYHRQGWCQAGFSAVFSGDGRKLFIGAVGSWYWQGQVFSQDLLIDTDVLSTKEQPPHFDDSYLGYSMGSGEFSGDSQTDLAVGVPRGNNLTGKVVVFNSSLTPIHEILGEQIGSYFGYCLSVVDVDGDRLDDIVISAPMHSDFNTKFGNYETGRVYVVYQGKSVSKKFTQRHILNGDHSKARFGLALTSLGDINRDSFGDFAVGAPYWGENSRGAVFIYHGSKKGVIRKPSQVLYASEIHDNLRTFGFSLSGGMDVDANEYPDLIVGAYDSDKVVFFKSRPVVSVIAHLEIEPDKINLDETGCSLFDTNPVSCVIVSTCLEYTGEGVPSKLDFQIETILDSKMENGGARLFFLSNEHENRLITPIELVKGTPYCKKVFVYIKSTVRDKLTSIMVEMNYTLLDDKPKLKRVKPILNQYIPTLLQKQVQIQKHCGRDNVCIPDLIVTAVSVNETFLMGDKESLELVINIINAGEDAYESTFFLDIPLGVHYINVDQHLNAGDIPISCSEPKSNYSTLKCDLGNPLAESTTISFKVLLEPSYLNSTDAAIDFVMEVNSTNPENGTDVRNNIFNLKVPIKVKVELIVSGISETDPVFYNKSITTPIKTSETDIGSEIIHLYDVKNRGPSDILEGVAIILWPTYTLSHHHLLYLVEQPEVIGSGRCEFVPNINPLNLTIEHKPYSMPSSAVIPLDGDTSDNSDEDNSINNTSIHSYIPFTKRRKRHTNDDGFQNELSCGPTLCTQIHCQYYNLAQGQHVLFRVRSRLWTETLIEFGFDNVTISSKLVAKVTKLPYAIDPNYLQHKVYIVNTLVNPTDGGTTLKRVPWWIIAAAVCTGVLVLSLLVLILWKVGFFKRKRPFDEFEREPLNKPEKNGMMLELGDEAL